MKVVGDVFLDAVEVVGVFWGVGGGHCFVPWVGLLFCVCGSGGLLVGSTIACLGLCDQIYFWVNNKPLVVCSCSGFQGVYCRGC